jgi:protein SCO1/2
VNHRNLLLLVCISAVAGIAFTPNVVSAGDGLAPAGEPLSSPNANVGIDERIGAQLPLDLELRDEGDRPITLRQCIDGKPTILVPMYYRCPLLCNQVLQFLVETLREMPQDFSVGGKFNVVAISFDPKEHGELAAPKRKVVLEEYGRQGNDNSWRFLTGGLEKKTSENAIRELMQTVGYRYEFDKSFKEYNHPTGIVIVSPQGKITRYFMGIRYSGDFEVPGGKTTLRLSLIEAADGKGGSLIDNIYLRCYTFDHVKKGYSLNVLRAVQIGGIITLLAIGICLTVAFWRERRHRESRLPVNIAENLSEQQRGEFPPARPNNDGPPSGGN